MTPDVDLIPFNHDKNPGIEFDIFSLEQLLAYDHPTFNPLLPHKVEFYILVLVTSDQWKHAIDFEEFAYLQPGVMTIRKDQIHKYYPGDATGFNLLFTDEFIVSHLDEDGVRQVRELFNELLFCQHTPLDPPLLEELHRIIREINYEFDKDRDGYSSSIIRNLLQVLISRLHRERMADIKLDLDRKYIQQFLAFQDLVQRDCSQSRSVQYFADQLNVTSKTLYNITQRSIKKSPKAFIDEEFLLQIKRLLINSDLQVKEIAYQFGFNDPGNFYKFFRRLTGATPESFRKQHLSH